MGKKSRLKRERRKVEAEEKRKRLKRESTILYRILLFLTQMFLIFLMKIFPFFIAYLIVSLIGLVFEGLS